MKTLTALFFTLILFLTVSGQKKMTDRELDGYQGRVKSVSIETLAVSDSGDRGSENKRAVWEVWSYDRDGRKSEEYNPQAKSKLIFNVKDGVKMATSIEKKSENSDGLNFSFIYQYDSQGRVKTERKNQIKDGISTRRTFKYDEKGRITEETIDDPVAKTRVSYRYDEKGNLIEKSEDRDIRDGTVYSEYMADSKSRTVYSDHRVDAQGNWTQRKSALYSGDEGRPYVSFDYQVFTYYE